MALNDAEFWDEKRKLVKEDFITFDEFYFYFTDCGLISKVD
jgi:hypothetical protein